MASYCRKDVGGCGSQSMTSLTYVEERSSCLLSVSLYIVLAYKFARTVYPTARFSNITAGRHSDVIRIPAPKDEGNWVTGGMYYHENCSDLDYCTS